MAILYGVVIGFLIGLFWVLKREGLNFWRLFQEGLLERLGGDKVQVVFDGIRKASSSRHTH